MKLTILDEGMLITAQTEFESSYIESLGTENLTCYVKHGLTATEVVGIKVERAKEKE